MLFCRSSFVCVRRYLARCGGSDPHLGLIVSSRFRGVRGRRDESLVAAGPYRRVRNPLYFANVLMIVAMGEFSKRVLALISTVEPHRAAES
jgi:hypothetical protein